MVVANEVVEVLYKHVGNPRAFIGRFVHEEHSWFHEHDLIIGLVVVEKPVDEQGLEDPGLVHGVFLLGDDLRDQLVALGDSRLDYLV